MHEQLALGTADAPQRRFVVGSRQQQDLGVLGTEQPARSHQKLADGEAELGRALGGAHRLVEELDVLPLLALLHVAAERRDGSEHRHDEQEDGCGANLEELDDGETSEAVASAPSVEVTSVRPSCGAWRRSSAIAITAETSRMPTT